MAKWDVGPPDLPVLGGLAFACFAWTVAILPIKNQMIWMWAVFVKFAESCMGVDLKQISVFLEAWFEVRSLFKSLLE